jgi:hypothetical protein
MQLLYLDSSAAMKLFLDEDFSIDIEEWLARHVNDRQITAHLTRAEVRRGDLGPQRRAGGGCGVGGVGGGWSDVSDTRMEDEDRR